KVDSDPSPKKKHAQATKGTRLKTSAKVAKSDKKKQPAKMPKANGLNVLFVVALTEAEQMKLATKRSKTQLHISHASGSSDGVDTQLKVLDEQQQKTFSQDDEDAEEESDKNDDSEETKSDNDEDDLTHPNLSTYKAEDREEEKPDDEEEEEKADNEEVSSDQRVSTPPDYEKSFFFRKYVAHPFVRQFSSKPRKYAVLYPSTPHFLQPKPKQNPAKFLVSGM
ncbi:hypothetical protein Tco_1564877, partial [Tanacetum coccineum]